MTLENYTPTLYPLQPTHLTELLEAWRRLHSEYDPISSMRRVAILQPPRCQRVEDLGPALEDWLSKKRHYETLTDRNGRPCQASDDSLMAAMFRLMPKSLEETVMFANEDEGFQELFDRLLAYSSTKQSVRMSEIKRQNRRHDPMEVDALSKGKRKGKKGSSGFGKEKGQNSMWNVVCWNCGKSGHCEKDCKQKWTQNKEWSGKKGKSKGKNKGKGKLNSIENWQEDAQGMPMDGLGMTSKLKNGGKQQAIRMGRVQHSGRMPMIRLLGNQKDQLVDLR